MASSKNKTTTRTAVPTIGQGDKGKDKTLETSHAGVELEGNDDSTVELEGNDDSTVELEGNDDSTVELPATVSEFFEGCDLAPLLVQRFDLLLEVAHDKMASAADFTSASAQFSSIITVLHRAKPAQFAKAILAITAMIKADVKWTQPVINRVMAGSMDSVVFWAALVRLSKGDFASLNYAAATACFNDERIADQLAGVFTDV